MKPKRPRRSSGLSLPSLGRRRGRSSEPRVKWTCESVENWFSQRGDALPRPVGVSEHLAHCKSCRREADEALHLGLPTRLGESLPSPSVSPRTSSADSLFVRSVMAGVRQEVAPIRRYQQDWERKQTRRRRQRFMAAASLLFAFACGLILVGRLAPWDSAAGPAGNNRSRAEIVDSDSANTPALAGVEVSSNEGSAANESITDHYFTGHPELQDAQAVSSGADSKSTKPGTDGWGSVIELKDGVKEVLSF